MESGQTAREKGPGSERGVALLLSPHGLAVHSPPSLTPGGTWRVRGQLGGDREALGGKSLREEVFSEAEALRDCGGMGRNGARRSWSLGQVLDGLRGSWRREDFEFLAGHTQCQALAWVRNTEGSKRRTLGGSARSHIECTK